MIPQSCLRYDPSPMANKIILALLISITLSPASFAQKRPIPPATLLEIVKAEDERRWDDSLRNLLSSPNPLTRKRAALAAGRIGNEDSVSALTNLLENDADMSVRSMAAFALGAAISDSLNSAADQSLILFGLTAALRSRPANAGPVIAKFLTHSNPRVRADAGNALARLRLKDGNDQLRRLVASDVDPIVRANAARVLGISEDKQAYEALLARAIGDSDSRVRVSAIRALASLKDPRAAKPLLKRVEIPAERKLSGRPAEVNELLEIATTLGRLLAQQEDQAAITSLRKINEPLNHTAPEVELALVRIAPAAYLAEFGTGDQAKRKVQETILLDWRAAAGIAAALGEIAALPDSVTNKSELAATAQSLLRAMLDYRNSGLTINTLVAVHSEYAIADVLRALAAFKPQDLATVARVQLKESDVVVRGTAADLLGDLPPSQEITAALGAAWPQAANDVLNDAALSILDSLGKQKTTAANDLIKEALKSGDLLVRRRAVTLLKANGAGDFSSQIGTVHTRNTEADYKRALARIGKPTRAVVTTSKGSFTIDLLPEAAPLTVDNFVQLAQRDYYRNITIHRVVPNFVIQDGDPRGDGNGGPGYQIRCEINEVPYDRAAVGMALSGKDTGGSQWFVTHSPQPHLDGGYTVFGRVVTGMDVVDRIVRGDVIESVVIRR